jgi:carbonic anhydrase
MKDFDALLDGYRRFRSDAYPSARARFDQLAQGQSPRVMVIACSDSRVDPTMIFDASPGEIFVVRNIANLVPPYENDGGRHGVSAAVEFAVTQLEVDAIVVLGHGKCGGVHAALSRQFEGSEPGHGGFIAQWIKLLDDARDTVVENHPGEPISTLERELEHEAVAVSLRNLRTFPWIAERERQGRLALHGAWFAIGEGELHRLNEATGRFHPA